MGVDTIRCNGSKCGRSAHTKALLVQSLRENTRWEGVYDYIHQQLMLDESGDFRIIWERYFSFCDSVICVPKAMRDRLVVDMLIKEI